jgi:hypothetical protein
MVHDVAQYDKIEGRGFVQATSSTGLRKNLAQAASPRKSRPVLGVMSVPVTVAAG